jgi:hypothetical protein
MELFMLPITKYLPKKKEDTDHHTTSKNFVSSFQTGEITVGSHRKDKMLGGIRESFMEEVASENDIKCRYP